MGPSHHRCHKFRVSLWSLFCAHGILGTPYGEVRDITQFLSQLFTISFRTNMASSNDDCRLQARKTPVARALRQNGRSIIKRSRNPGCEAMSDSIQTTRKEASMAIKISPTTQSRDEAEDIIRSGNNDSEFFVGNSGVGRGWGRGQRQAEEW